MRRLIDFICGVYAGGFIVAATICVYSGGGLATAFWAGLVWPYIVMVAWL